MTPLVQRILKDAECFRADDIHRFLPHLARFFLLATFVEDGLRMWYQWHFQRTYLDLYWGCGYFLSSLFVLINLVTQLAGSLMIALRCRVRLGCQFLGLSVVLQIFGYNVFRKGPHFIRFLSLIGSLLLLSADALNEPKRSFAGLPSLGIDNRKSYMQLSGRCLVALLFLTTIRMESSHVLYDVIATVMMTLIAIGYRARSGATALALLSFVNNFQAHAFWANSQDLMEWEHLKYEFFQNLSVIGGLLLIVSRGPGDMSMEARKKMI